MGEAISVYITTADRAEAMRIGRAVVEARLAACANVLDGVRSVYWWQGTVEESGEAALLLKTRTGLFETLLARVRELHSYSCPCVVAWPIVAGNPDYLAWLETETGGGG